MAKIVDTLLETMRMAQDLKALGERVSKLADEQRAQDRRMIRIEERVQMMYDIAVSRGAGQRPKTPPAPPALTDDRT